MNILLEGIEKVTPCLSSTALRNQQMPLHLKQGRGVQNNGSKATSE
jgi:hypothetical protein